MGYYYDDPDTGKLKWDKRQPLDTADLTWIEPPNSTRLDSFHESILRTLTVSSLLMCHNVYSGSISSLSAKLTKEEERMYASIYEYFNLSEPFEHETATAEPMQQDEADTNNSNGSKTNFYNVPSIDGYVDVDQICEHLEMTFFEGNCMKALFGIAIERKLGKPRHNGTDSWRDANKLLHYANKIKSKEGE